MPDRPQTPPPIPRDEVVSHLVALATEVGSLSVEVRSNAERHDRHLEGLRVEVREMRREMGGAPARLEDHTGRIKRLEAAARAQGGRITLWKGITYGIVATLAFAGGVAGFLSAIGVFR